MDIAALFSFKRKPPMPLTYTVTSFAPGRANLIGEHTDYNGGMCIPFALHLVITCKMTLNRVSANKLTSIELSSEGHKFDDISYSKWMMVLRDCHEFESIGFSKFGEVTQSLLPKGTAAYVVGSLAWYFSIEKIRQGHSNILLAFVDGELLAKIELSSTLPQGAGLSSSAALCMSVLMCINDICGNELSTYELCALAMKVEHTFALTKCGLMDQLACGFSKPNHFVHIDFASSHSSTLPWQAKEPALRVFKAHPIFEAYQVLLLHTGVSHNLAETEYNLRRSQCQSALGFLQTSFKQNASAPPSDLGNLSFIGWQQLLNLIQPALTKNSIDNSLVSQSDLTRTLESYFAQNFCLKPDQSMVLAKRAAHGIYENRRVASAIAALEKGLPELLHKVLVDGHASLDVDYDVSCRELNLAALYLHQSAVSEALDGVSPQKPDHTSGSQALPKIIGPRMTGGGFGGSVIALIRKDLVGQINLAFEGDRSHYFLATGLKPRLIWSSPSAGASILSQS